MVVTSRYTAAEDLVTLYIADFVHTNVGTIAADPTISLRSNWDPTSFETNGAVIIDDESLSRVEKGGNGKVEVYTLKLTALYSSTTTAVLQLIVTELDRINNANNDDASRSYYISFIYQRNTGFRDGLVNLIVEMRKEWEEFTV